MAGSDEGYIYRFKHDPKYDEKHTRARAKLDPEKIAKYKAMSDEELYRNGQRRLNQDPERAEDDQQWTWISGRG